MKLVSQVYHFITEKCLFVDQQMLNQFVFISSALAWLAGVVSLNDLRLSANLPGHNFKTAVAGDGKFVKTLP